MREQHDTVVIGGGQAGLAMSAVLAEHGREHVVLERGQIGGRWRTERWDSLRFQFPNWSLALPGYRYSGRDPDGFARWDEILDLIERYAADTRAPVREHVEVTRVVIAGGGFLLTVPDGTIEAKNVVLATGPFQRPKIPALASALSRAVLQIDPTRYRGPDALPDGAVLVVGSGASGCQIADELLRAGRRTLLSVSKHRRVPRRLGDNDIYWWLERMGRFEQTLDDFPGRQPPPGVIVTGVDGGYDVNVRAMAADGLSVLGGVRDATDAGLTIAANANAVLAEADASLAGFLAAARELAGTEPDLGVDEDDIAAPAPVEVTIPERESLSLGREQIAAIVWATGYEYDFEWLQVPVLDAYGRPIQQRGVSSVPGLYFLGLHWMHTFKSGLLAGVGHDAEYIAGQIDQIAR